MVAKIAVKPLVSEMLPSFVAEDNPIFVSFMEAYFEYVEQRGMPLAMMRSMKDYIDSDAMLGDFITSFFEEMKEIPKNIIADKQLLAKHIYELYQAKGTIRSYDLLFRIMFGESCRVYLPREDMLRVSGGNWSRSIVIRATQIQGDPFDLAGQKIQQFSGSTIKASAVVDNVVSIDYNGGKLYDLFLSSGTILGSFDSENDIASDSISVRAIQTPVIEKFIRRGGLYKPGQILNLLDTIGEGCEISISTTLPGSIDTCLILDGGSGHSVGETLNLIGDGHGAILKVKSVDSNGAITSVNIWEGGQGYYTPAYVDFGLASGKIICTGRNVGQVGEYAYQFIGYGYTNAPIGLFDTNVIIGDHSTNFVDGETVIIQDDYIINENYGDILLESGESVLSEISETEAQSMVLVSSSDNEATIQGVMDDIYFLLEDGNNRLLLEDGIVAELEISTQVFTNRTFIGTQSGAKARILYNNPASIDMNIGSTAVLVGRYLNDDSKISEYGKRIQDSYYYQDFSYVIRSGIQIDKYKNAIYKLLHPAGTAMFGSISIESRLEQSMKIVLGLTAIVKKIIASFCKNEIKLSENFVKIKSQLYTRNDSRNSNYLLDRMKFGFGPHLGGINGTSKTVQTYSNAFNQALIYNSSIPNAHFEKLTFNDVYEYSTNYWIDSNIWNDLNIWNYLNTYSEYSNYKIKFRDMNLAYPSYVYHYQDQLWIDNQIWSDNSDYWIEP